MWITRLGYTLSLAIIVAACGDGGAEESIPPLATTTPPTPETTPPVVDFNGQELPSQLASVSGSWTTDFSRAIIDLNEILVGIPTSDPRDAIPPIDQPAFKSVEDSGWLADREPGVLISIKGDARFYPLSIMTRHEIVNDQIGAVPVAVTYCPLCNTGVAFDRRFQGEIIRLGVSGLLRNSDLIMWDDVTESLWQQVTGEAIVGAQSGNSLTPIPTAIVSWSDFVKNHPDGMALSDVQGFGIPYGRNPYEFYSSRDRPLSFFQGDIDPRFPAMERVVGVTVNGTSKAYAFPDIQQVGVVNDLVGGEPIVVFWGAPDTADGLDASTIAEARPVGTGIAYSSVVSGTRLTFDSIEGDLFRDRETGSTWTLLGLAISGELSGSELMLVTHRNEFWFAWQAFFSNSEVWQSTSGNGSLVISPNPQLTDDQAQAISTKPYRR